MVLDGFKFGMLLQLAIGPVCLFVFNTGAQRGFFSGWSAAAAVVVVDYLYITLSGFGVAAVLKKDGVQAWIRAFGAAVLLLFGADMAAGACGFSLLPAMRLSAPAGSAGVFVQAFLLTASNPLTVIFWSGVFAAQTAEHHYDKSQLRWFGLGCVLATASFLTLAAACGSFAGGLLSAGVVKLLNGCVGFAIMFFGAKLLCGLRRAS